MGLCASTPIKYESQNTVKDKHDGLILQYMPNNILRKARQIRIIPNRAYIFTINNNQIAIYIDYRRDTGLTIRINNMKYISFFLNKYPFVSNNDPSNYIRRTLDYDSINTLCSVLHITNNEEWFDFIYFIEFVMDTIGLECIDKRESLFNSLGAKIKTKLYIPVETYKEFLQYKQSNKTNNKRFKIYKSQIYFSLDV